MIVYLKPELKEIASKYPEVWRKINDEEDYILGMSSDYLTAADRFRSEEKRIKRLLEYAKSQEGT